LGSDNAAVRATVVAAVRYTFTDQTEHTDFDALLRPMIPDFLTLIKDPDLVMFIY